MRLLMAPHGDDNPLYTNDLHMMEGICSVMFMSTSMAERCPIQDFQYRPGQEVRADDEHGTTRPGQRFCTAQCA